MPPSRLACSRKHTLLVVCKLGIILLFVAPCSPAELMILCSGLHVVHHFYDSANRFSLHDSGFMPTVCDLALPTTPPPIAMKLCYLVEGLHMIWQMNKGNQD